MEIMLNRLTNNKIIITFSPSVNVFHCQCFYNLTFHGKNSFNKVGKRLWLWLQPP